MPKAARGGPQQRRHLPSPQETVLGKTGTYGAVLLYAGVLLRITRLTAEEGMKMKENEGVRSLKIWCIPYHGNIEH